MVPTLSSLIAPHVVTTTTWGAVLPVTRKLAAWQLSVFSQDYSGYLDIEAETNGRVRIPIKISLEFVPNGPINKTPPLVQIMAWRRPGDKPLSEPMMVSLPTHICVTRPQWIKKSETNLGKIIKKYTCLKLSFLFLFVFFDLMVGNPLANHKFSVISCIFTIGPQTSRYRYNQPKIEIFSRG